MRRKRTLEALPIFITIALLGLTTIGVIVRAVNDNIIPLDYAFIAVLIVILALIATRSR